MLKAAVNRDNENPFAWYQLGIIYDREGDQPRAALATAERNNLEGQAKLALASAEMAIKGIPPGTPGLSSGAGHRHGFARRTEKRQKNRKTSGASERGAAQTALMPAVALAGGVIGAALTAAASAGRGAATGQRPDRAPGHAGRPANPRRHRRCAARPRNIADADGQSRGARNAVRIIVERLRQARRHTGRILRLRLPLLQDQQPRTSTGWSRRIKGLRVVYRELPILGPESVAAARLSLAASKAGRFNQFHDALWAAGRAGADDHRRRREAAGLGPPAPQRAQKPRPSSSRISTSPASSARPERRCSSSATR